MAASVLHVAHLWDHVKGGGVPYGWPRAACVGNSSSSYTIVLAGDRPVMGPVILTIPVAILPAKWLFVLPAVMIVLVAGR